MIHLANHHSPDEVRASSPSGMQLPQALSSPAMVAPSWMGNSSAVVGDSETVESNETLSQPCTALDI